MAHKTKQAALKAARKDLGAEAVETVDFQLRNTGNGWDYETIPPANDAAAGAQAQRMPDQADATLTSEPPPKQSREEKRLARIAAADARNQAKAPAKKAAAPKKKPPRAPTPARRPSPKPKPTPAREPVSAQNKTDLLIGMMSRPEGATSKAMEEAASWQPHSVRGLIGTLKAKRGMNIVSSKDKGQPTVYRIPAQAGAERAPAEVGDVI